MKKGYQTTEFWLTVASMLVGLAMASDAISSEPILRYLGLAQIALAQLGYTGMRTIGKAKHEQSQVVALAADVIARSLGLRKD